MAGPSLLGGTRGYSHREPKPALGGPENKELVIGDTESLDKQEDLVSSKLEYVA